jgi:hypothetical protein
VAVAAVSTVQRAALMALASMGLLIIHEGSGEGIDTLRVSLRSLRAGLVNLSRFWAVPTAEVGRDASSSCAVTG